jgi:rhodanese-related sulfurtransferase
MTGAATGMLGGLLQSANLQELLGRLMGLGIGAYDATLEELGQATAEISTNELRRILADASAMVFDTRTPLEYSLGHIPGALNVGPREGIAMSQYVSDAAEISKLVPNAATSLVLYCNGPYCGKSRRLGEDLLAAGFADVRRYQLGTPVWRALVGTMAMGIEGVRYVLAGDNTAAFIDTRTPEEFRSGSLPVARNVPANELIKAKDDGRLPMDDFNTRVVVFGREQAQAQQTAEALVGHGFNNVKFFEGTFLELLKGVL